MSFLDSKHLCAGLKLLCQPTAHSSITAGDIGTTNGDATLRAGQPLSWPERVPPALHHPSSGDFVRVADRPWPCP